MTHISKHTTAVKPYQTDSKKVAELAEQAIEIQISSVESQLKALQKPNDWAPEAIITLTKAYRLELAKWKIRLANLKARTINEIAVTEYTIITA